MLVTLADYKTKGGNVSVTATNSTQTEWLLKVAEKECLKFAGLSLEGEAAETLSGQYHYILNERPVKEIISVTSGGEPISYTYNKRTQAIKVNTLSEIVVNYSLGFQGDDDADSIRLAIIWAVQYWLKKTNSNSVGETSRSTELGSVTIEHYELPAEVKTLLAPYRKMVY